MTRDEALRIAHEKWTKPGATCSESIVDTLCALGILKLDEPKSVEARARSALRGLIPDGLIADILNRLNVADLRIVEK